MRRCLQKWISIELADRHTSARKVAIYRAKTKAWLARHRSDTQVRAAQLAGWRSRAVAKLVEIDKRHGLLQQAKAIVDLGAAPGGWCQLARQRVRTHATVIGVDILECEPLAGVTFLCEDLTLVATRAKVCARIAHGIDVLLSDAAPNLTGNRTRDEVACEKLHEAVFALADAGGARNLVLKTFTGSAQDYAQNMARERYSIVNCMRLAATRKHSSEVFLVAKQPRY